MDVSVVVPAHNEEGNIRRVVDRILSVLSDTEIQPEIVLVDDNSTDGTPQICDELASSHPEVVVVHRTSNSGFGNAIKAGLTEAGGEILVPFMGDLSDDPADIPKLVAAIEDGYHVAYGSRFVSDGSVRGYPRLKLFYNRAYNNVIRLLFGIRARDVTNAFTAYRREVIEEIGIDTLASESFDLTAELPLRAHILGFRSTEVPVSWRSRDAGVSKLNATRKGPLYGRRLLHMFVTGNAVGLKDIFGAIATGNPLRVVGAALLGVLILFGLFSLSGFEEVYAVLGGTQFAWLGIAAVAYFSSFLFRTWRYRVLLRTAGHLADRGGVFRCMMTGWFVNFLLPARIGDAARGLTLKTSEGVPFGVATGMVVVERIMDMLVLGTTTLVIAALFLPEGQADLLAVGALGICGALFAGLLLVYFFGDRLLSPLEPRFPSVIEAVSRLQRALGRTARNPYAMALALVISLPVWLLEASTIFFTARALGLDLGILATTTIALAAFVAQAVPVTPAGIGTYEATIAAVGAIFGLPQSSGIALALTDHFVRVALVYVVGTISTIHVGFRSRAYFRERSKAKRQKSDEVVGDSMSNADDV